MSKKPAAAASQGGAPATTFQGEMKNKMVIVHPAIYRLLKEEKTQHILTWAELKEQPDEILADFPGHEEPLKFKVTQMMTVHAGYLPSGYPFEQRAHGRNTCLRVELITDESKTEVAAE